MHVDDGVPRCWLQLIAVQRVRVVQPAVADVAAAAAAGAMQAAALKFRHV